MSHCTCEWVSRQSLFRLDWATRSSRIARMLSRRHSMQFWCIRSPQGSRLQLSFTHIAGWVGILSSDRSYCRRLLQHVRKRCEKVSRGWWWSRWTPPLGTLIFVLFPVRTSSFFVIICKDFIKISFLQILTTFFLTRANLSSDFCPTLYLWQFFAFPRIFSGNYWFLLTVSVLPLSRARLVTSSLLKYIYIYIFVFFDSFARKRSEFLQHVNWSAESRAAQEFTRNYRFSWSAEIGRWKQENWASRR